MDWLNEKEKPVSQPFDTLEAILNWSTSNLRGVADGTHGYLQGSHKVEKRPKVLVCHDMKGGYLEDRFIQGCDNPEAYKFYHWHLIDTFVYFSHRFITVPPVGWVRAAHRNGVEILGTIITEWEDGAKICKELLQTRDNIDLVASNLADIAFVFEFDGWLINIENEIEENSIPDLQYFVERVTYHCHSRLRGRATVLWYDSVTEAGALGWQNELNDKNQLFFDVCDGIFLNYAITEEKVSCSKQLAQTSDRCHDVYVGVDVFGRATPGGGGFNCNQVLELISKYGLSCAIFAQGWVYEVHGADKFDDNEVKFWKHLKDFLPRRTHTIPLKTSFCQGYGQKHYVDGQVVGEKPWHNLSLQQLQPCYGDSEGLSLTTSDAYCGGGCLQLITSKTEGACVNRIFKLSLDERGQPLNVLATWKEQGYSGSPCDMSFVLMACDTNNPNHTATKAIMLVQESCLVKDGLVKIWNQYVNRGSNNIPMNDSALQFAHAKTVKDKCDAGWMSSQWDVNTDWLFTNPDDSHQSVVLYSILAPTSCTANAPKSQSHEAEMNVQLSEINKSVLLGKLLIDWKQPSPLNERQLCKINNMTCLAVNTTEPVTHQTLFTFVKEIEDLKMATKSVASLSGRPGPRFGDGAYSDSSKEICLLKSCQTAGAGVCDKQPVNLHVLQWESSDDNEVDYYMIFTVYKSTGSQFTGCTCTNVYVAKLDGGENTSNIEGYLIKPISACGSLPDQTFYLSFE